MLHADFDLLRRGAAEPIRAGRMGGTRHLFFFEGTMNRFLFRSMRCGVDIVRWTLVVLFVLPVLVVFAALIILGAPLAVVRGAMRSSRSTRHE